MAAQDFDYVAPDPYPADPALPRMTLAQMIDYLILFRGDGYMATPVGEARRKIETQYREMNREDLARFSQIIKALEYFELQREKERSHR